MLHSSQGGLPEPPEAAVGPVDLAARVDDALAVQALAFGLAEDEIGVRRHVMLRHAALRHTRALGATTPEGRLVGFVYGMPNDRTQWWSTVVHPYLREDGLDHWLSGSFVITELHVHPRWQQLGLGRRLITEITDTATEERSLLSAIDTDSPARRLYHHLGYRDLARRVIFPGAASPYAVMGARLPLAGPR